MRRERWREKSPWVILQGGQVSRLGCTRYKDIDEDIVHLVRVKLPKKKKEERNVSGVCAIKKKKNHLS